MSYVGRLLRTLILAAFMLGLTQPVHAQTGAIKDAWLVMKVHSEMVDEDVLTGSNIDVDVKNGVVTLEGTVPSEAARARAMECAKQNDGVKNVVDHLRIAPARAGKMDKAEDKTSRTADKAGDKMAKTADKAEDKLSKAADKSENAARKAGRAIDDGWIKSKIYAQFMADWNTVLNDSDIDVDVNNNFVTLNGTVKSPEARTKALSIAKATDGVKGVKDNLRVAGATR